MRTFKILKTFILILSLLASSFYSEAKSPEEKIKVIFKNAPYDAIIVPGVPYKDEYWSKILLGRIYWSNYLYKNGITKNIIYSGSAVYTPYIEAEIMAMYGKALGIPPENIYTETNAEHSVENVYYSFQIAQKLGFKKIALDRSFSITNDERPFKKNGCRNRFYPIFI
ncbi:MAG: YdcF family protein [Bacteroidales bacterium]|nr:YdcF family protein [Bacteroidales bacterium]